MSTLDRIRGLVRYLLHRQRSGSTSDALIRIYSTDEYSRTRFIIYDVKPEQLKTLFSVFDNDKDISSVEAHICLLSNRLKKADNLSRRLLESRQSYETAIRFYRALFPDLFHAEKPAIGRRQNIILQSPKPQWSFSFSADFTKKVRKCDKNLRSRIMGALLKISENPAQILGDTVMPLSGDKKGFYRYRIGDFRLVYALDESAAKVFCVDFDSRGSVY